MRLIDADVLDKAFTALRFTADGELVHWGDRKDWCLHGSEVEALIADAPTVDAVPVVRCKDCNKRDVCRTSNIWATPPADDWFCADGERRNEDETD